MHCGGEWTQLHWIKRQESLHAGELVEKDRRAERVVSLICPSVFANWYWGKLAPTLPRRLGNKGLIFPQRLHFEGKTPRSLGKTFLCYTRFIPQSSRVIIYNYKFPKVNVLRKGKSGVYSQEETCQFTEAGETIKAVMLLCPKYYMGHN